MDIDIVLLLCFLGSFLATLIIIPKWIRKTRDMGLVGADMNKPKRPAVSEAGGISVIAGTSFGILLYIFLNTFYFSSRYFMVEIFAVLTGILLAGFVGFIDDILGWKVGVKQSTKVLMTIPIAIPLAVVNAGDSVMFLPFIGPVNFGIIYPLLIIPVGIVGATNGFNMLAGYNGLESGMGVIILTSLSLVAWFSGSGWVSMIALCMVFALLAFLLYNRPPAKIFPGDSLTYSVGAAIACVAIMGNMEKLAFLLFIPYFFDAAMFIRFRFVERRKGVEAFARVNSDGSLELPHSKIYDFTHLALWLAGKVKSKVFERDVVLTVFFIEVVISAAGMLLWFLGIF